MLALSLRNKKLGLQFLDAHFFLLALNVTFTLVNISVLLPRHPQHYASRSGHAGICQLLLERGADVNSQTRSGKASSLHRAAYSGHSGVLKTLITHGADPRLYDSDGQTALHKVN